MVKSRGLRLSIFAGVLVFPVMAHGWNALRVDFGGGALQSEYQAFPPTSALSATLQFPSPVGVAGTVAVSVSSPSMDWRVRHGISGGAFAGSSNLLSDFVWALVGSTLSLQLTDLAAGQYQLTTYHHDTEYGDHGALDVSLDDATGTTTAATDVVQSAGTAPVSVAKVQVRVVADGVHPVIVRLDVVAGTGNGVVLNGFELAPLPLEPRDRWLVDFGFSGFEEAVGVQPGYEGFERPYGFGPSPETQVFTFGDVGAVTVSVEVTPIGASLGWRARNELMGGSFVSTSRLWGDFVKAYSLYGAHGLNLRFTTLPAGRYLIRTYHHDSCCSDHGHINVYVDDAAGTTTVATNVAQSSGYSPSSIASLLFEFTADGANPVTIRFEQIEGNAVVLNGFDLSLSALIAVKPATWSVVKGLYRK